MTGHNISEQLQQLVSNPQITQITATPEVERNRVPERKKEHSREKRLDETIDLIKHSQKGLGSRTSDALYYTTISALFNSLDIELDEFCVFLDFSPEHYKDFALWKNAPNERVKKVDYQMMQQLCINQFTMK